MSLQQLNETMQELKTNLEMLETINQQCQNCTPSEYQPGLANHAGQHAPNTHHKESHQRVNRGTAMNTRLLSTVLY